MDIETRVTNLENMLASIVDTIGNNKFYTDSDIAGVRQGVNEVTENIEEITPWTQVKEVSCGETEVIFEDVPEGPLTAFVKDSEGRYLDYKIDRVEGTVIVYFEPLDYAAEIKISIN